MRRTPIALMVLSALIAGACSARLAAEEVVPETRSTATVTITDSCAHVWGSWMETLAPTTSVIFISDAGEVVMDYTDTLKITSTMPVDSTAQVILDVLIESHWVHFDSLRARADSLRVVIGLLRRALEFIPAPDDGMPRIDAVPAVLIIRTPAQRLRLEAERLRADADRIERRDALYRDICRALGQEAGP